MAQLGAKQSKQGGKHENPEITEIRKPGHAGAQKPAKLRVDGPENPGVGRCDGDPGPMLQPGKAKKLESKRSQRLTKSENRNMRGPQNLQS